jgi:hypothetical protein
LHRAAGGEDKHRPSFFLRIDSTKALVEELSCADMHTLKPVEIVTGKGKDQGTYVAKELVYAYAMWISAKFHLQVIRAYDAMVSQQPAPQSVNMLPNFDDPIATAQAENR